MIKSITLVKLDTQKTVIVDMHSDERVEGVILAEVDLPNANIRRAGCNVVINGIVFKDYELRIGLADDC